MSFPARYPSVCGDCDAPIEVGALIESTAAYGYDKQRHGYAPRYRHAVCPEIADLEAIKPTETRCPRCSAYHPGEC